MAATFVEMGKDVDGGLTFHHVKATADAATAVYTLQQTGVPISRLLGVTFPFKTVGTASAITQTFVESTGVLTIAGLSASDVIYFTLIY